MITIQVDNSGDEQCLPNAEIVAQYLYLFSAIYLVTQNIRNILQLPQRSYENFLSEDPILFCMKKRLLQPISFKLCCHEDTLHL